MLPGRYTHRPPSSPLPRPDDPQPSPQRIGSGRPDASQSAPHPPRILWDQHTARAGWRAGHGGARSCRWRSQGWLAPDGALWHGGPGAPRSADSSRRCTGAISARAGPRAVAVAAGRLLAPAAVAAYVRRIPGELAARDPLQQARPPDTGHPHARRALLPHQPAPVRRLGRRKGPPGVLALRSRATVHCDERVGRLAQHAARVCRVRVVVTERMQTRIPPQDGCDVRRGSEPGALRHGVLMLRTAVDVGVACSGSRWPWRWLQTASLAATGVGN